jgi:hypothetical protein
VTIRGFTPREFAAAAEKIPTAEIKIPQFCSSNYFRSLALLTESLAMQGSGSAFCGINGRLDRWNTPGKISAKVVQAAALLR